MAVAYLVVAYLGLWLLVVAYLVVVGQVPRPGLVLLVPGQEGIRRGRQGPGRRRHSFRRHSFRRLRLLPPDGSAASAAAAVVALLLLGAVLGIGMGRCGPLIVRSLHHGIALPYLQVLVQGGGGAGAAVHPPRGGGGGGGGLAVPVRGRRVLLLLRRRGGGKASIRDLARHFWNAAAAAAVGVGVGGWKRGSLFGGNPSGLSAWMWARERERERERERDPEAGITGSD